MRTVATFCLAACLAATAALGDGEPAPGAVAAEFDAGRLKDLLFAEIPDAAKEIRVEVYASAGSELSADLTPDATPGTAATGVALTLCDGSGAEVPVAGTKADKSKEGTDAVKWRNVPLPAAGPYTLIARAATPGGIQLKLGGSAAASKTTVESTVPAAVGAETSAAFAGVRGGTVKTKLKKRGNSKFVGTPVRIERPDGSVVFTFLEDSGQAQPILDVDGTHTLFFRNDGNAAGDWTAKITVSPPKLKKRTAYVRPEGTALVPKVKKLDPDKGVHFDPELRLTILGADFQPGVDVRLLRNDFFDIVATDVDVISESEIRCTLDLDTRVNEGKQSIGKWTLGVWNAPQYTVVDDPFSLVKQSPTSDRSKPFNSVGAGSIRLPDGVEPESEVWFLDFNDGFQSDLNRMGLGSEDPEVRTLARNAVEAYVVASLRDLFGVNETSGNIGKNGPVPVSFVVARPSRVAGDPGVDFNRIEIGGDYQNGDERSQSEPLLWGFAPVDPGNVAREDLSLLEDDGQGGTRRVGRGARTGVLDPDLPSADPTWTAATSPLRNSPLIRLDRRFFLPGFSPGNTFEANRYRDLVQQFERCSREIAAIVAHHIGKAMGVADGGTGPMQNPSSAGAMWLTHQSLSFGAGDLTTLGANAVNSDLPGTSDKLNVGFFPLVSTRPGLLPNATTDEAYTTTWDFVGGRNNAIPSEYKVQYVRGSTVPIGMTLSYAGLSGTPPLFLTTNVFYCSLAIFQIAVTDERRGGTRFFIYRLNVLPNIPKLPSSLQPQATQCRDQVLAN